MKYCHRRFNDANRIEINQRKMMGNFNGMWVLTVDSNESSYQWAIIDDIVMDTRVAVHV